MCKVGRGLNAASGESGDVEKLDPNSGSTSSSREPFMDGKEEEELGVKPFIDGKEEVGETEGEQIIARGVWRVKGQGEEQDYQSHHSPQVFARLSKILCVV